MCCAVLLSCIRKLNKIYLDLLAFWIAIVQCCRSFDYRHLFILDNCWGYMSNILRFYHICQRFSWWVSVTLSIYLVQVEWSFLGWLRCNKVCEGTEYLVVTNIKEMCRGCCLFEGFDIWGGVFTCIKNSWCRKRCGVYSLGLEVSPIMCSVYFTMCVFFSFIFVLLYFLFYFYFCICFLSFLFTCFLLWLCYCLSL